jgi:broad specificity polyphosphatase/5'/3'-nucleotidase SurE
MAFEKIYIGKGTQVPNLNIARVTLKLSEVKKIAYTRDGVEYITFEVAKLKEPDKFGRDYTVYYSKKVEEVQEPAQKKTGGKRKTKKEGEKLPF